MADDPGTPVRRRYRKPLVWGTVCVLILGIVTVTVQRRRRGPRVADRIPVARGACRDFNVLLVSIDTLRADRVGCYGYDAAETPTLDRLARQGVRCSNAITPTPLTLPGHASLLTGLNPFRHGARDNAVYSLSPTVRTLAEVLKGQGYRTGAVLSAFVLDRRFGLARGFDDYDDDLTSDGQSQAFGHRERPAEAASDRALAWLERHGKERFFLWAHYFDPHFPYAPPEPFKSKHAGRPYDGEIAYADAQVGRLIEAIDRMKLRDRTLIVVVSDHGEAFGEHGEITHGLLIYDTTLRVPVIFNVPSCMSEAMTLPRQVGLIDVMPTVLDMLGQEPPKGTDGVSLLSPPAEQPRSLYVETLHPRVMHHWSALVGVRREDAKFIMAPRPEIYDLQGDPNEMRNLYGERSELARALFSRLRELAGGDPQALTVVSQNLPLDEESRQRLAGLGYVVASSAPASAAVLPDPKDMMDAWASIQRAESLANAGRYTDVLAILEPFVHHHPDDPRAVGMLADAYINLGRYPAAAEQFKRQAALIPRRAEALSGFGLARFHEGRVEEAEQAFVAALKEDPQTPAALFGQGLIASRKGRDAEALALFEKCAEAGRGSQTGPAYHNIGVLRERMGKAVEARKAYEQALALDPYHVQAALALSRMLQAEHKNDEAIAVLRRSTSRRNIPELKLELARLLSVEGRSEEAIEQIRGVLTVHPKDSVAHMEMGLALRRMNRNAEAAESLRHALVADAGNVNARLHLGILLGQMSRLDEACKELEEVVRVAPGVAMVQYNYGVVLALQNRLMEASKAFGEAARLEPDNAATRSTLGQVLLQMGRRDEAIVQFREALRVDPNSKAALAGLRRSTTQPTTTHATDK